MFGGIRELLLPEAVAAARQMLGWHMVLKIHGQILSGRIVETEAYDQTDAASHSYKGRTPRTDVMFGPAGHLYVYFTYGMHYCCNVTIGPEGHGAAVLIRALEPLSGQAAMERNRRRGGLDLTNGPAKLCQALRIDKKLNGHDLSQEPLLLKPQPLLPDSSVVQTTRIGISQAKDVPWRFYIKDSPWVSKP
jgi:DNA-3-methyladenine glycosylase